MDLSKYDSHPGQKKDLLSEDKRGRPSWKNKNDIYEKSQVSIRRDLKKRIKKIIADDIGETQEHVIELALVEFLNKHGR